MEQKIDAYWFAASDRLPKGDRRKVVVGKKHSLRGKIVICHHALHGSRDPFDALQYAPGPFLYMVKQWGDIQEQDDKLGSRHREYVAMRDATNMLRLFARKQALGVRHLWDMPDMVREYLETGDQTKAAAAYAAAGAAAVAAGDAASAYAAYAARAAAYAARAAAREAADAAGDTAARAEAYAEADAGAYAAAREAADAAAREMARVMFNNLVKELFAS